MLPVQPTGGALYTIAKKDRFRGETIVFGDLLLFAVYDALAPADYNEAGHLARAVRSFKVRLARLLAVAPVNELTQHGVLYTILSATAVHFRNTAVSHS